MAAKIKSANQMYFTKDHDMVRRAINEFVNKEINPYMDEWEEQGIAPLHDLFKKMGDLGFLGIRFDPKYGGQGLDYWYDLILLEEMSHCHGMGIPMAVSVQTHMATPAIEEFGSEYLKETYLKPAIAGDMVASIAVTEPGAGSDVAALQTTAKKDGDAYVINGSKTYITNGTQADFLTLLARTSDDPGYHSFSLFVVPTKLDGFQVSRKLDKLGVRSSDGRIHVIVLDAASGQTVSTFHVWALQYNVWRLFTPLDMAAVVSDVNGNGKAELAVLGVRESDGLALSSRNVHLGPEARRQQPGPGAGLPARILGYMPVACRAPPTRPVVSVNLRRKQGG